MKKITCAALALLMALTMAACSGKDTGSTPAAGGSSTVSAVSTPSSSAVSAQ